jgi:hypothetical protein
VRRWAPGSWLGHAALPVALGGLLYAAFRSEALLGFRFARAIGGIEPVDALRSAVQGWAPPGWVTLSLPDALWAYALAWAVERTTRPLSPAERSAWLLLPIALGPGFEIGQGAALVPGTFDPLDLVLTALAVGLALRGARSADPAPAPA